MDLKRLDMKFIISVLDPDFEIKTCWVPNRDLIILLILDGNSEHVTNL